MNPITKPFTFQMPCIALSHLTEATRVSLYSKKPDAPFLCASHENGFFMTAPNDEERAALPQDLQDVFAYFDALFDVFGMQTGWLMVDVDGDRVPCLPVYE